MPLYRWNTEDLEPIASTSFEAERLREREDLQRLLRDRPEVVEEGLFVVAEEFGNWEDSGRRIDLLCLDTSGQLVVVELKTTTTGDHSELQAVRYAAMVSNMTLEQVIEAHSSYLAKRRIDGDARVRILDHLGVSDEVDAEIRTERPRIILASAGFSKELTTSVLWLRDYGLDIGCVKLQLYRNGNGLLMDTTQLIPLPEAADYLVKIRGRAEAAQRRRQSSNLVTSQGAEAFRDAIEEAGEEHKPILTRLLEWAVSLEQDNLATLGTRRGDWNTSLRPSLLNVDVRLVIIYKSGSSANYDLFQRQINARAPKASARIEQILGSEIYGEGKTPNLKSMPSDDLLDALTDAYREANGLPTTPHPGNGPDSPAPEG